MLPFLPFKNKQSNSLYNNPISSSNVHNLGNHLYINYFYAIDRI